LQSKLRLDADDVDEYEDPAEDEEDAALQRKALQHIPEHKLLPYDGEGLWLRAQAGFKQGYHAYCAVGLVTVALHVWGSAASKN
jgi:hypothetical protein